MAVTRSNDRAGDDAGSLFDFCCFQMMGGADCY